MRIQPLVIIVLALYKVAQCAEVVKYYSNLSIPGHTFKINCEAGSTLNGQLKWDGISDLDLYIYRQGANLYGNAAVKRFQTEYANIESVNNYVITDAGTYYIKIYPYYSQQKQTTQYNFNITISNPYLQLVANGTFIQRYKNNVVVVENSRQLASIKFNYQSSEPVQVILYYFNLYGVYTLLPNQLFCIPYAYQFVLILKQTKTSAIYLSSLNFTLYSNTDKNACPSDQRNTNKTRTITITPRNQSARSITPRNQSARSITPRNQSTGSDIIVGCIIGGFGLLLIILAICSCFYHKRPLNKPEAEKKPQNNFSSEALQIHEELICPICLQNKCDSVLQCQHMYHRNCIAEWMKKNSKCPVCRSDFTKPKLANQ